MLSLGVNLEVKQTICAIMPSLLIRRTGYVIMMVAYV